MKKKYLISIFTLLALVISTLIWDSIKLPYDYNNQIYGEYAKQNYNPLNDTLRYIFFVSIPLITFFVSYLSFNKENLFTINQVLKSKVTYQFETKDNKLILFFFYLIIIFIIIDFISLDYRKYFFNLDFFHEGAYLASSKNSQLKGGFWTTSYIDYGLYGNFNPIFFWKLFNIETIGSLRFSHILILFFNKIFLVLLSKKISENLFLEKKTQIIYFVFLSILAISLVNYEYWVTDIGVRFFLILIFLLVLFDSIKTNNNFLNFLVGSFSAISIFWYIDIGAYLNVFLFFLLIYLIYRKEYQKFLFILSGLIISWTFFLIFFSNNEINAFYENTKTIFLNIDYIDGLIYPTPFISKDPRSTRALLLIILTGILVIIFNFNKKIKAKTEVKIFFSLLYLLNILIFKSALVRSDTPHIRWSLGLLLFLLISIVLYFAITGLISFYKNKSSNKNFYTLKRFYLIIPFTILLLNFFLIPVNSINFKMAAYSFTDIKKLLIQNDGDYLSEDYVVMLDYYKNLVKDEKCIQIFTNETAIPYLLKKPTCSKFYLMWTSSPVKNQKLFVEELKFFRPQFILFDSEKDIYRDIHVKLPIVLEYINTNYSFHSKFKSWTFVKLK